MKNLKLIACAFCFSNLMILHSQEERAGSVKAIMAKVADWQIQNFEAPKNLNQKVHHPLSWPNAALYVGMLKWAEISNEKKYFNWLIDIGVQNNWSLHERVYHADDHAVGQLYLGLYEKYRTKKMLKLTKRRMDYIFLHPARTSLKWTSPYHQDRWNWCDALFMSPPVWAKLYDLTEDERYLDFLMSEYTETVNFLFDSEENLFYRDESYINKRDNGTKIFWSRGNGWVFAGLVNIMKSLNPNSKEYAYFMDLYLKMARRITELQTSEGHWAMSLLGEEFYPTPETSGSSFFVYGLAWGLNEKVLDKKVYGPIVEKGWKSLVKHVTPEGMLGFVQPIGAAPGEAWSDKTEVYGTGGFLCAASEVFRLYSLEQ